jgi:hypothetical protein
MQFEEGHEVQFTLRGEQLFVRLDGRRWILRWRDRSAESEQVDRAMATLLQEHMSSVLPIVGRLLRAQPGDCLD